jgi:hypothetical protein
MSLAAAASGYIVALATAPMAFLACSPLNVPSWTNVKYGWIQGEDRAFTPNEWSAHGHKEVVIDQASRDFACPVGEVAAQGPYDEGMYIATGCGRRGIYVFVLATQWDSEPGIVREWSRALNVSTPTVPATEPPPTPVGAISATAPSSWSEAQRWIRLVQQGAHDLSCAPDQVTPDFVPQGRAPDLPVVEGCGKRATYLSERDPQVFRLSAIVSTAAADLDERPIRTRTTP